MITKKHPNNPLRRIVRGQRSANYSRYATIDDAQGDDERVMFDLFRIIERRMSCNGFASSRIPFDPQPWIETRYHSAPWAVHKIPEYMLNAIVPTQ